MTDPHYLMRDYLPQYIPEGDSAMSWSKLNFAEPAVIRGVITAVLALAAALGFSATTEINGAAEALVPILAFLIPLLQSVWTRGAVYSPASVDAIGRHAAPDVV